APQPCVRGGAEGEGEIDGLRRKLRCRQCRAHCSGELVCAGRSDPVDRPRGPVAYLFGADDLDVLLADEAAQPAVDRPVADSCPPVDPPQLQLPADLITVHGSEGQRTEDRHAGGEAGSCPRNSHAEIVTSAATPLNTSERPPLVRHPAPSWPPSETCPGWMPGRRVRQCRRPPMVARQFSVTGSSSRLRSSPAASGSPSKAEDSASGSCRESSSTLSMSRVAG